MDLSEFSDTFFEEADELLVEIESHLLDIDPDDPDPEQLNAIFRAAHSIKGGAGTFGFTVLQETTHVLENLLDDARKGNLSLNSRIVDQFLEAKDMLKDQLDAYRNGTAPDQEAFEALCQALQRIAEENRAGADAAPAPAAAEPPAQESAAGAGFELFDGASADADDGTPRLQVRLREVGEADRTLIIEELGNLGEILDSGGDEACFDIQLATEESPDNLEAVLCFVIDAEQLEITPLGGGEDEATAAQEASAPAEPEPEPEPEPAPAEPEAAAEVAGSESSEPAGEAGESPAESAAPEQPAAQDTPVAEEPKPAAPPQAAAPKEAAKAPAKPAAAPKAGKAGAPETSSIRVAVDKVDQVINLVGELIITQSMLNETVNGLEGVVNSDLLNGINLLQRNARDLQDAVMSIRMLPMDYVFSRFPRLVRDLAGKLGKEINLVTEGESTELDKGLTERIIDPLTHLVRNSLDHGLESPEARARAGKPREGKLVLSAQHQGGNILIEVRDDGAGLNREKILEKARANGIPMSDNPSDDEVWQLIFAPGFSTAEQVSDLSGRGVGMDVVKRNIQSMGGHVEIMSKQGQGTTTRIVLPLTLAILDGMLIKVAGEIYILPVSSIIESLQLRSEHLSSLPGNVQMLKVRGEYYPVISVYDAMGLRGLASETDEGGRGTAVMVQAGNIKYVMLVDELLGQQQVVVKNLEANYRRIPGVSAATILGDGNVALILDMPDLYRLGQEARVRRGGPSDAARAPSASTEEAEQA
ncbi:chemotaxis protein CheA [Mangrovimicrobium sediminis]|uniref:Chemotaxis protein CheA n=1 Tax=Mangrovimicrobium sediminis TaxID=2562682 RepID=A0A4Z0M165_9GAMM|nr:chemotaxis protein CheA [Haliea sp. SAOS-164]TGD73167.1 chemotaxis protein CheA [Haliea sp. SAOS-164]